MSEPPIEITARTAYRLDFTPRDVELPEAPGPWRVRWSVRLPGSRQPKCWRVGDHLIVLGAPDGLLLAGDDPPGPERVLAGEGLQAFPSSDGRVLLTTENGTVYRWTPGGVAERIWESGVPSFKLSPEGLTDGRLLASRPSGLGRVLAAIGAADRLQLVDPGTGAAAWSRIIETGERLPWRDSFFAARYPRGVALRAALADGRTQWTTKVSPRRVSRLIGVVGDRLWLATYDDELVALDAERGEVRARVRVEVLRVPSGVLDRQGRFHVLGGSYYVLHDFAGDGRRIEGGPLDPGFDTTIRGAYGSTAIPTLDGRVVFDDEKGGVFVTRAARFPMATQLKPHDDNHLLGFTVRAGVLYTLGFDGTLTALAPEG